MKPNGKPPCFQLARALCATLDLFIFLLAAGVLVFIEFFSPNVKRGFFCGDKDISFEKQQDTISIKTVVLYGLSPIFAMWIVEFIFIGELDEAECSLKHRLTKSWRRMLRWFKSFGINLVFMLLVMDVSKVLIGEHRPHFLATCQPDAAATCVKGTFVAKYECTNREGISDYKLRDSSRSFPSGHACITMYTSLFLIWYFQCRLPKLQTLFFVPFLQCLLILWTCFCCISRITDHRHHTTDVIGGAILGIVFAVYTCHILVNNFCDDRNSAVLCSVNGSTSSNNNRRGDRRLLSTVIAKEEFTLNNLE